MLRLLRDPVNQTLALLQGFWRAHDAGTWSETPELYVTLGEQALKLGEPLFAYDVVDEGTKYFPRHVPMRQQLALALARSGASQSANAVLAGLYDEGHRDEETVGLLARTHKDLAETASPAEATAHRRRAYDLYAEGHRNTGGYWSGINAATLALVLGNRDRATTLARAVAPTCRERLAVSADSSDRYWLLSTLGEAALLLENWSEAEAWYAQAIEVGRGRWGDLRSTRRNALLIAQRLAGDTGRIERLFAMPIVVVFTGHMIDRPDREAPRFPPQLERAVQEEIRRRLAALNAGFGFASAACGSDILFHEAIHDRNGETHVVLPYRRDLFAKESVDIVPGADWTSRYERVLAHAADVIEVSQQKPKGGSVLYQFTNLLLHGLATVRAEQLDTVVVPLVVWDGLPGDGPGGTGSTVDRWRRLGLRVDVIDLQALRSAPLSVARVESPSPKPASSAPETSSGFTPEIRALLFADAQGFSKLNDEEIPLFVEHFLGLVARLADQAGSGLLMKNTWGDGLYFVFAGVREAGEFALALRDEVRSTDWTAKGLRHTNLRIGLHAGPVYSCQDPVTSRVNYVGLHVSRAARIEPITPAGQVYASQEFAALAAAEGVEALRCDYVGRTAMAHNYGTFGTYLVRRRG